MGGTIRKSVFDGSFYLSNKEDLTSFIKASIEEAEIKEDVGRAYSYVTPHAGYIYSEKTAAYTYKAMKLNKEIEKIETIVIVGPNHTGKGRALAVSTEDWETPLGKISNDKELSKELAKISDYIDIDEEAHKDEHSIEVQLPFLQFLFPRKRVVMICMGDQSEYASKLLSNSIIKAAENLKRKVLVLASSDFNHYESADIAKYKDFKLIDQIKMLDCSRFNKAVHDVKDSACGFGPISVAMLFAKEKGATKGALLKYTNSGEQTGDYSNVVAYSSIAFV